MLVRASCLFFTFLACLIGPLLHAQQADSKNKVLVFDFGGVIAKGNKAEVGKFISTELFISQEEAMKAQADLKVYQDRGGLEENFWQEFARSVGKPLPDNWMQRLDDVRLQSIKAIPGMLELIRKLHEQNYQTALLSNVRMTQARIKRKLGYYDLFNPVLLSYEIGVGKPNSQAYKILLERLGRSPESIIFIDNKSANIEAARSLGIDGILFENAEQLTQELQKRGIDLSHSINSNSSPSTK